MEENPGNNWKAIVLAVFCALVILAFLTGAAIMLADGITKWNDTHDISLSLLPAFLTISALLLASALIARAGWLAVGRIRNKPSVPAGMKSFPVWAGILYSLGWVLSIVLAIVLVDRPVLQWFSLPFYLLAVGMPVYGLVRLGTWGLNPGSKLRSWGTLSGGMTVAPLLSGIAEGVVLVLLVIIVLVMMGLDPQRLEEIRSMAEQLKTIGTQEQAIALLAPFITNPLVIIGALLFLAVVTPLVEETAKSLPVWASWGKLESPAQGFALGALSGAGFGLMEGLLISTTPGSTWGATLSVRAASSAMHIITSGIVGWGIGIAASQKRVLPALWRYLLGVSIHGVWNACVVVMVYASAMTVLSGNAASGIAGMFIAIIALFFISMLILAAPVFLWAINRHFRKTISAPAAPQNIEPPASGNMVI
jgi:hypothetical protein